MDNSDSLQWMRLCSGIVQKPLRVRQNIWEWFFHVFRFFLFIAFCYHAVLPSFFISRYVQLTPYWCSYSSIRIFIILDSNSSSELSIILLSISEPPFNQNMLHSRFRLILSSLFSLCTLNSTASI